MKLSNCFSALILSVTCFMTGAAPALAEDETPVSLLNNISQRIETYPEMETYKVEQIEKKTEMNKKWEPVETTTIRQTVSYMDGKVAFEILEATKTKEGKTTDISEEHLEKIKKQNEKNAQADETTDDSASEFLNTFFPFKESTRSDFDIRRLDDAAMEGKKVFILESTAKKKDKNRFEGKCYIDPNTFDVLKIDVKPSKNPKFVKDMRMEMMFEVLPDQYFVMKNMKVKVDAKLVFKPIREISEIEFVSYEFFDPDGTTPAP
jgi:hypothetical protein